MILRAGKTFVAAFSLIGSGEREIPEPVVPPVIKAQAAPPVPPVHLDPPAKPISLPTIDAIVESIQKSTPEPKPRDPEPIPVPPRPNPKPRPIKRDVPYPPRRPVVPPRPAPVVVEEEAPIKASWGLPPREFVPYLVSEAPKSRRIVQSQPVVYSEPQVQAYEPAPSMPLYQPSFSMPLGGVSGFGGLGPATGGCAGGSCR